MTLQAQIGVQVPVARRRDHRWRLVLSTLPFAMLLLLSVAFLLPFFWLVTSQALAPAAATDALPQTHADADRHTAVQHADAHGDSAAGYADAIARRGTLNGGHLFPRNNRLTCWAKKGGLLPGTTTMNSSGAFSVGVTAMCRSFVKRRRAGS